MYAIIGVLQPSFEFPSSVAVEVLTPLGKNEEAELRRGGETTIVHDVIGRLRSDVTLNQARSQMEVLESHIAPPPFLSGVQMTITVDSLQSRLIGNLREPLFVLLCAVGFLLLMACANISNLLLSRAVARQQEMAIRWSLGASRSRLIRQLLLESAVLALLGCAAAIGLVFSTRGLLWHFMPKNIPGVEGLPLDWRVLSFAFTSACLSALLFGLGPALISSAPTSSGLTRGGWYVFMGAHRQLLLNALASTQIALAIVLLCGGGLMLQSFWNVRYRDLGFRTEHLLTAQVHLGKAKYADTAAQILFIRRLLANTLLLPGIEGVAVGDLPPGEGHATNGFAIEGQAQEPQGHKPTAKSYAISSGYLRVLQIPLLKGRGFYAYDSTGPHVALVNETFVRRNLEGQDPLGRKVHLLKDDPWSTIIGVVADVKTGGLLSGPESVIYFPYSQVGTMNDDLGILVRSALAPVYIGPELRRQIARLDFQQPIVGIQTMEERLNGLAAKPRLAAVLLGCFAGFGVMVASVGLYGVMSLSARGKRREIGIHLALGARPYDVLRMVLMQSFQIIASGIGLGVCCALLLTRLMRTLLYGVSASDPLIFSTVAGLLVLVALAASYFPARQASQINPMATLRVE